MQNQAVANVLIVDDQPDNILAMKAVLEDLDANLVTAQSGEAALKAVLKDDFAVILLDVQMAGMDGFETAALIKQREKSRQTPIIFVTAINRSDEHVFRGYDLGAVDYLFKPFVPEILRTKVGVFVELFKKTGEIQNQAALLEAVNRQLELQLEEVNRLNRELETLNHGLESFSYSVSHDLRAPLRGINGFSQALAQDYYDQLDEQGRFYLNRIQSGCKRMADLIDALLHLSRLSQSKLDMRAVDLSGIALEIADDLQRVEPERLVEFRIESGLTTKGDVRLLRLMLENLFWNSWKFTRHEPHALIEFGCVSENGSAPTYFIRDNGAGFDMQYSDQLFLPFQRLHLESEFEGTGIGLATVQRIVYRHHGQIWAEGCVDEGATFYFTLR